MANTFNEPINEIIRKRHSVRNYENTGIPKDIEEKLQAYLDEINNSEGKSDLSRIDIGICMCHFYLSAKEKGLKGEIKVLSDKEDNKYKYVASWSE